MSQPGGSLGADRTDLARGALLLFLTNSAAISLVAGVMFAIAGFVPSREVFTRVDGIRSTGSRIVQ